MPQLQWDEYAFLECLEVEPEKEDHDVSHTYQVIRDGIRLLVTVWQFESVVQITLHRDSHADAISSFASFVRGAARFVNDGRGSYIQLMDCVIGPNRFWYQEAGNLFSRELYPHGVDVHFRINPDIRVDVAGPNSENP